MKIEIHFSEKQFGDYKPDNEQYAAYIEEALACWGGQRRPSDKLFNGIDIDKIVLKRNRENIIYEYPNTKS